MCNKVIAYEKEGLNFLLSLPLKHKNHIKNLLLKRLKRVKITALIKAGEEGKTIWKISIWILPMIN